MRSYKLSRPRAIQIRDLFVMILGLWYMAHPDDQVQSMGGCLMEKTGQQAAAPDLLLYVGPEAPYWTKGEPRQIDLDRWRVPDLVGEVADTTLATDLNEMKQLDASLLSGLTIDQLEEALERSVQETNVSVAGWFMQTLMGKP